MADRVRATRRELARTLGVATGYVDGLGRRVHVGDDTLTAVLRALGVAATTEGELIELLEAERRRRDDLPDTVVAWDGRFGRSLVARLARIPHEVTTEAGSRAPALAGLPGGPALPAGVHTLTMGGDAERVVHLVAAPRRSWTGSLGGSWMLALHLAALRTERTRTLADLVDLAAAARWSKAVGSAGVAILPILPTFDDDASPYAPVSRLFWNERHLDLGPADRRLPAGDLVDVAAASIEVREALAAAEDPGTCDPELARYAEFRGAQRRLGREWRRWPAAARRGHLGPGDVDADEARLHRAAQQRMTAQIDDLSDELGRLDQILGLDLAIGVHPHGYDVWSRQELFADGVTVGAPPDRAFPSGQNWGFAPLLPRASAAEGHRYVRACLDHQAHIAGLLRIDHVMAARRVFWIPEGATVAEGTYVGHDLDHHLALITLTAHRHECAMVGEDLGTVPAEVRRGLDRHGIWGMSLAQFELDGDRELRAPRRGQVASFGTHDTPTFAGWRRGIDLDERVRHGLADPATLAVDREARHRDVAALSSSLGVDPDDETGAFVALLERLGSSEAALVIVWIEDLWLEVDPVNVPATSDAQRPNWRRPMRRHLEEVAGSEEMAAILRRLDRARRERRS